MATVPGGQVLGPGHVADARVPELHDVVDGQLDAPTVVDGHRRNRSVLEAAVDEHEGHCARAHLVEQLAIKARGGRDEAVDLAGAHRLEVAALALGIVVGVDDQRRVAVVGQAILDSTQDGGNSGLVMSGMSTPMVCERLVFSPRAMRLGR